MSYVWGDVYKSARWIIETLVDVVAKGGNFQVGYGPGPNGTWDQAVIDRLEQVGDWLKVNGQAIYATRPYRIFQQGRNIRFTTTKDCKYVFVFLLNWPENPYGYGTVCLESLRARPNSEIKMLGLDHNFEYTQNDRALTIKIPEWFRDNTKRPCEIAYILKIETKE